MKNAVAIVTGASSGIGRATAVRISRDFRCVVLVARSTDGLEQTSRDVRANGSEPLTVVQDLTQASAAQAVLRASLERFGRVDALVNIAGSVPGIDLFAMSDAQWDESLALKFHGARRLTIAAWDALKASKGSAVFVSGVSANAPKPTAAAIAAVNAAVEALAKAFAERGLADGIQVNTISPGAVLTGRRLAMLEAVAKMKGVTLDDAKASFLQASGIKRFASPEELAELFAFSLSEPARWMTGTVLRMDGGEVKAV